MIQELNDTEYQHPVVHVISYVNLTTLPSNGVYVIQIDELTKDTIQTSKSETKLGPD